MDNGFRIESDSVGSLNVDKNAYYGVQSLRAKHNFNITGYRQNDNFINNLAKIKKATAITNNNIGRLDKEKCNAIVNACDDIISGKLHEEFITDAIQGGAGTSMNMNANEVIANRAIEILGKEKGDYPVIHPNDHVNMAQSTNDVIPTAGKLTCIDLIDELLPSLERLINSLLNKGNEYDNVIKMGRTQLQDAVPMKICEEFYAYASALKRDKVRLCNIKNDLYQVNLGGTAIGSGINATKEYRESITNVLSKITNYPIKSCENLYDGTSNLDGFLALSSTLKILATNLSKMCNDLRLLSSGPRTGIAEITLPAKQNGSSIMPGKVNPVIPEVVSQVCFMVCGADVTINMAVEAGQLELNAFEPVIFQKLFESLTSLKNAIDTLIDNCIDGIIVNEKRCNDLVKSSTGIATALCPFIGYKKSAEIAKESLKTGLPVRELVVKYKLLPYDMVDLVLDITKMV